MVGLKRLFLLEVEIAALCLLVLSLFCSHVVVQHIYFLSLSHRIGCRQILWQACRVSLRLICRHDTWSSSLLSATAKCLQYIENSWCMIPVVLNPVSLPHLSINCIRSAMRQVKSSRDSSPLNALRSTSTILLTAFSNWPSNLAKSSLNTTNVSNVPIWPNISLDSDLAVLNLELGDGEDWYVAVWAASVCDFALELLIDDRFLLSLGRERNIQEGASWDAGHPTPLSARAALKRFVRWCLLMWLRWSIPRVSPRYIRRHTRIHLINQAFSNCRVSTRQRNHTLVPRPLLNWLPLSSMLSTPKRRKEKQSRESTTNYSHPLSMAISSCATLHNIRSCSASAPWKIGCS